MVVELPRENLGPGTARAKAGELDAARLSLSWRLMKQCGVHSIRVNLHQSHPEQAYLPELFGQCP